MATAATRSRSPTYPSFPLSEAIDKARIIHSKDRKNLISREVVAKHMGYSSLNGAADKALSNMMQFGLLERVSKGELRITELSVEILLPDNEAQYKSAIWKAAFSPPLFQTLKARFEDQFSVEALKSFLIKQDFVDSALGPIVRSYTETCEFVKRENASEGGGAPESIGVEVEEPRNDVTVVPAREMTYTPYQAAPTSSSVGVPVMVGEQVLYSEVAGPSNYLKLIASGEPNEDLIEGIESYLSRLKRRVRAKQAQTTTQTKPDNSEIDELLS